jgi:hypothetical protein
LDDLHDGQAAVLGYDLRPETISRPWRLESTSLSLLAPASQRPAAHIAE